MYISNVAIFLIFLILALGGIGWAIYMIWEKKKEIKRYFEPYPSFGDTELDFVDGYFVAFYDTEEEE